MSNSDRTPRHWHSKSGMPLSMLGLGGLVAASIASAFLFATPAHTQAPGDALARLTALEQRVLAAEAEVARLKAALQLPNRGRDVILEAEKTLTITARDRLTLISGDSRLEMKKDGTIELSGREITIKGAKVAVKGSLEATIKGSKIKEN